MATKWLGRVVATGLALCFAFSSMLLGGCTADEGFAADGVPELSNPEFVRTPPPVAMPELGGVQVADSYNEHSGMIDISNLSKGYVGASVTSPVQCKMRVIKGTIADINSPTLEDNYNIDNDGTVNFFPLTRGDGHYTFVLAFFVADKDGVPQYSRLVVTEADVVLEDEFVPYLIPTRLVRYTPEADCVQLSYELTRHCATDLEVVQQVYYWIVQNITYDYDKAEAVRGPSGYEPYPDDTLAAGAGICYDYASLAAAMLRANGIPTILVKGDVAYGDGTVYHAWSLVYLKEAGWIAVGIATNPNDWTRIDTTFASTGGQGMSSFVGDGKNYTDLSYN